PQPPHRPGAAARFATHQRAMLSQSSASDCGLRGHCGQGRSLAGGCMAQLADATDEPQMDVATCPPSLAISTCFSEMPTHRSLRDISWAICIGFFHDFLDLTDDFKEHA
ncbi:MAG: hypothetical protein ACREBC_23540, partial [Pyrinomonadaceae bacterium]